MSGRGLWIEPRTGARPRSIAGALAVAFAVSAWGACAKPEGSDPPAPPPSVAARATTRGGIRATAEAAELAASVARRFSLPDAGDDALERGGDGAPARGAAVVAYDPLGPRFHLRDRASGLDVDVALTGAETLGAEAGADRVVYRAARAGGPHVLHRRTAHGTEDCVLLEQSAAPELTYEVTLGPKVAGLRAVGGTVELLDAGGAPRLRVGVPSLIEPGGRRVAAALSVKGCAFDADPAPPWGRPTTPPGAASCSVVVSWDAGAASYPLLVDPAWSTTGNMAHAHAEHASALLPDGRVLTSGGYAAINANADAFDPATSSWASVASMALARARHTATTLATGAVLVAGGFNVTSRATCELYTAAGGWVATGSMNTARDRFTATRLLDGRVLVAGGTTAGTTSAELYDPSAGTWTPTGSMHQARQGHTATRLLDGRVLVTGGSGVSSAEIYDPSTSAWTFTGSLSVARYLHMAVRLADGRVLVAGGGGAAPSAEIFSASTGTFTLTAPPSQFHDMGFAAPLPSGRVLVGSGFGASALVVEVYDPPQDRWLPANGLQAGREESTTTVLGDGSVLVAGGSATGQPTVTAERFAELANGAPCSQNAECASEVCVDGICCAQACGAACMACAASKTGAADGTCAPVTVGTDPNDDCTDDGSPSCGDDGTCDGAGACRRYAAPTGCTPSACATGSDCTSGFCSDHVCCSALCDGPCEACTAAIKGHGVDGVCEPVASGTDPDGDCTTSAQSTCGETGVCDGLGSCSLYGAGLACGTACAASTETALACDGAGTCQPTASTTPCAPFACGGATCATSCASDTDCDASGYCRLSDHACVPDDGAATACTADAHCTSGHCEDGVCCDVDCHTQACMACTAAKKGMGVDGVCGPALVDTDPDDECAAAPDLAHSCGEDGLCDGTGKCRHFAKAGKTCKDPISSCTAGMESDWLCDGAGSCNLVSMSCNGFGCAGPVCAASCDATHPCPSPATFCNSANVCEAKHTDRTPCSAGPNGHAECQSDYCVDGFCCDSACTDGACSACDVPTHEGTCMPVMGQVHGNRPKCSEDPDCSQQCNGGKDCAYASGGTRCGAASCTGGEARASACNNANGMCEPLPSVACGAYKCDPTATSCLKACGDASQCVDGKACDESNHCVDPTMPTCNADGNVSLPDGTIVPCNLSRCVLGACLDPCLGGDTDCVEGAVCDQSNTCVPKVTPAAPADDSGGCAVAAAGAGDGAARFAVVALAALAAFARRRRRALAVVLPVVSALGCAGGAPEPAGAGGGSADAAPHERRAQASLSSRDASPSHPASTASPSDRPSGRRFASTPTVRFDVAEDGRARAFFSAHPGAGAAEVELPADARGAVRVRDGASGVEVAFAASGARPSERVLADDAVTYRGALDDGVDLALRPTPEGVEDFVTFAVAPPSPHVDYDVDVTRVAGLRKVGRVLELLDAGGAPRLRVEPPFLVDARGERFEAYLTVIGCAVDASPRAPWGRPVTAPGAPSCTLRVAWDGAAVTYPAVLDPAWTTTTNMSTPRSGHTASLAGARVLVVGGNAGAISAELYDPGTSTWAAAASPLVNHVGGFTQTTLGDGRVLVAGGGTAAAELYDPGTGAFSPLPNMTHPRSDHAAALLSVTTGKVLLTGDSGVNDTSAELFDPGSNTFTATASMPTSRDTFALVELLDGRALAVGGWSIQAATALYTPGAGTWAPAGALSSGRVFAAVARLGSGDVIFAGGFDGSNDVTAVDVFHPASATWSLTTPLPIAREVPSGTTLDSGDALVAFGAPFFDFINDGVRYVAATGAWAKTNAIGSTRVDHIAIKLPAPSHKVLVAGGRDASGAFADALLFDLVAQGGACTFDGECAAGPCVDGVCCDRACGAACEACSIAKKGVGPNGVCAAIGKGLPSGGACTQQAASTCGTDGRCDGAGSCELYVSSTVCVDACTAGVAQLATCDGQGTCATPVPTTCSPYACSSTRCATTCFDDAQCEAAAHCDVATHTCKADATQGIACTDAGACATGFCVDGFCCDAACGATCMACSAAKKGGGVDGVCGFVAQGLDPDHECLDDWPACGRTGSCDGNGACGVHPGSGCVPGACTVDADCVSGHCEDSVCCDAACKGTCDACSAAARGGGVDGFCQPVLAGKDPAGECVDEWPSCTGQTGACDGHHACALRSSGACAPGTCAADADCASGHCVDGFCCDQACTGDCHVCAKALGATADGHCSPATEGTNPGDRCQKATDECGADGLCGGDGTCRVVALDQTPCGAPPTCGPAGVTANTCNAGQCSSDTKPCDPYVCASDGASCATDCSLGCAEGAYCDGDQCLPVKHVGDACTSAAECGVNPCADGYCCSEPCAGSCEACGEPNQQGTCVLVTAPRPGHTACTGDPGCEGACNGTAACAYPDETQSCGAPTCTGGVETRQLCNGGGQCKPKLTFCKEEFACGADGLCNTDCKVNADCAQGYTCELDVCVTPTVLPTCDGSKVVKGGDVIKDCAPLACQHGECMPCNRDEDCSGGDVCGMDGACVPHPTATSGDAGCSCVVVGSESTRTRATPPLGLALGLALACAARRRRRSLRPRS